MLEKILLHLLMSLKKAIKAVNFLLKTPTVTYVIGLYIYIYIYIYIKKMSVEKLDWGTKGPTVTQNVDKTRLAAPQAPCQATASGAEDAIARLKR